MAGIGKYKEGEPFTLKSGNKPTFQEIGSSPTNLKSFGIGKGDSPYKQGTRFNTDTDKDKTGNNKGTTDTTTSQNQNVPKAAQMAIQGLTSGLDAVYGTGKIKFAAKTKIAKDTPDPDKKIIDVKDEIDTSVTDGADQMPDEDWKAGEKKAKDMGHDMDELLQNQKTMDKNSNEWKENQNLINEALGNEKRHKID